MTILTSPQQAGQVISPGEIWPLRPECDECGADCHPAEGAINFTQWIDNQLCRECNDRGFTEYFNEVFYEPYRV